MKVLSCKCSHVAQNCSIFITDVNLFFHQSCFFQHSFRWSHLISECLSCHLTAADFHFLVLAMCLCLEGVLRVFLSRLIFKSLVFWFWVFESGCGKVSVHICPSFPLNKCYGIILPVLTFQKHQEFQLFVGVVQETLICYGDDACSTGLLKVFVKVVQQ